MLGLTFSQRLQIKPNWTREQIRAYKKSLKDKTKIQPAEQEEIEEDSEIETEELPATYKRFEKWTKAQLIDRICELEEEIKELKCTL